MGTDRKNSDHKEEMKHQLHEEQRMVEQAGNESQLILDFLDCPAYSTSGSLS